MSISRVSQENLRSGYASPIQRSTPAAPAGPARQNAPVQTPPRAAAAEAISPAGRALAAERARVERAAGTRDERLDSIKAAISAGKYDVSSRTLATTLVKNFAQ